ncbi:hypothetical protein BZZ01_20040 [Nostocales cyanobacterium HT-58-2]|nr:hypothetical protein BZZ01_20040 [Nostocales cyanobacterium HT-58-2]
MPSYTRNVKRDNLVFVPVNPKILYGFKTKDLTSISGVSAADIAPLGHLTATAASGRAGAILVVGANAPKPPRVTKRISAAAAGVQQSVSTFCATSSLAGALAAGWNVAKPGRGVLTRNASASRGTLTAIATLSNGARYCFPMNKADFDAHGAALGLESAATITNQGERDSLVRGTRLPRPGRASLEVAGGGTFVSFFSSSFSGELGKNNFHQLSEEVILNGAAPAAADIVRESLSSELTRSQIGRAGVRVFRALQTTQTDSNGNIIRWLWNAGNQFFGLIGAAFKIIGVSFTALWALVVSTVQYVWNFNWNISDRELDQQLQNSLNVLAALLGGTVGNSIGYLACGVLPGAYIFSLNEPLGAHVLANVAEEMAEEFLANVNNLIRYSFISGVQALLMWGFRNVRKLIKSNIAFVQAVFGDKAARAVQAWGQPNSKPWSFALALNNAVESIPNTAVQNFVEEFLEEAWEGCVEAGYVVANSLDAYIAQQKLASQQQLILGQQRYVEVQPDRTNERERIILAGPEQPLKAALVQTLSNYQLIENRDVGQLVGMPADDYLRAKPQSIRLVITFSSVSSPPWKAAAGQRLVTATYAVPDVKRSKCDWETIKQACGGRNGYLWGRYRATGILSNGRQMQVMGATGDEAEDRLRALVALSEATLVKKPTISEDRSEDASGSYTKQPTRIYPAFCTIMNQYQVPGARGSSIRLNGGEYMRRQDKILLWTEEKPFGTDELIAELLRKPGAEEHT